MIYSLPYKILTNDKILLSQFRIAINCTENDVTTSAANCTNSSAINCTESSVSKYIKAAMADNTRRGYQSDLNHFRSWGGSIPSTPEIVSHYLAVHAEILSPATLGRRVVSITRAHTSLGLHSPCKSDLVKTTLRGIKRTIGTKQRQAQPVLKNDLIRMVHGLTGIKGTRDKALLLIGFAGAFRRSELVALQVSDIEFVEQGLVVSISRSKTDQNGESRKIAIPHGRGTVCPVHALQSWLEVASIRSGAIFRPVSRHGLIQDSTLSGQVVAVIVKDRVRILGLDPNKFSGHSLRAGLVTSAAQAGVSNYKIKQQTGHRSDAMLNRYIRDANIFVDNVAGALL